MFVDQHNRNIYLGRWLKSEIAKLNIIVNRTVGIRA